jgi:hypothetical protein
MSRDGSGSLPPLIPSHVSLVHRCSAAPFQESAEIAGHPSREDQFPKVPSIF